MRFGLSAVTGRHRMTLTSVFRFRALHVVLYMRVFQCAVLAGTGSVVVPIVLGRGDDLLSRLPFRKRLSRPQRAFPMAFFEGPPVLGTCPISNYVVQCTAFRLGLFKWEESLQAVF